MEENHSVAIIGDNPEALLLSVLYAEAGIPNYLVGPFGDDGRTHTNRPGIEEALWLLGILTKSGKIRPTPDYRQLPLPQIRTLLLATHASTPEHTNGLEMTVRNLASGLATGTNIAFSGLCRPHYTSSVLKTTVEKHGGLKAGTDLNFYYLPLFWSGERIQEFKEKPKCWQGLELSSRTRSKRNFCESFRRLVWLPVWSWRKQLVFSPPLVEKWRGRLDWNLPNCLRDMESTMTMYLTCAGTRALHLPDVLTRFREESRSGQGLRFRARIKGTVRDSHVLLKL